MAVTCPHTFQGWTICWGHFHLHFFLHIPPESGALVKQHNFFRQRQSIQSSLSTQQLNSKTNLQSLNIYLGLPGSMSGWLGPLGTGKHLPILFTSHLPRILLFGYSILLSRVIYTNLINVSNNIFILESKTFVSMWLFMGVCMDLCIHPLTCQYIFSCNFRNIRIPCFSSPIFKYSSYYSLLAVLTIIAILMVVPKRLVLDYCFSPFICTCISHFVKCFQLLPEWGWLYNFHNQPSAFPHSVVHRIIFSPVFLKLKYFSSPLVPSLNILLHCERVS